MGMFDDLIPSQTANLNGTPPSQRLGVMPMQQTAAPQAGGMFDDLIPPQVPGGLNGEIIPPPQAATVQEPRLGDFMKPAFGGHNPIADVYDVAAPALDPSSNRPILERAQDTANFVASAPLQALRLPRKLLVSFCLMITLVRSLQPLNMGETSLTASENSCSFS